MELQTEAQARKGSPKTHRLIAPELGHELKNPSLCSRIIAMLIQSEGVIIYR